jgi:hypothetical protein
MRICPLFSKNFVTLTLLHTISLWLWHDSNFFCQQHLMLCVYIFRTDKVLIIWHISHRHFANLTKFWNTGIRLNLCVATRNWLCKLIMKSHLFFLLQHWCHMFYKQSKVAPRWQWGWAQTLRQFLKHLLGMSSWGTGRRLDSLIQPQTHMLQTNWRRSASMSLL